MLKITLASTVGLVLATPAFAQSIATKPLVVRTCQAADSLMGHMERSRGQRVWATFWPDPPKSELTPPNRTVSWQVGKSRVAGIQAVATAYGPPGPADSASVVITIRIVDTISRSPDSLATTLILDSRDTVALGIPNVLPETGMRIKGIPAYLLFNPNWPTFQAIAKARKAAGQIGPHAFSLYDWELHDLNTLYRAVVCGVGIK
jgi:hypothetical protein